MALQDHPEVIEAEHSVAVIAAEHLARVVCTYWNTLRAEAPNMDEDAAAELTKEFAESMYWDGGERLSGEDDDT